MDWTNPEYADMIAEVRRIEADTPRSVCPRCKGHGTFRAPGMATERCRPCNGSGTQAARFRGFVMS